MKPHRFVQARRPLAAKDLCKYKLARPSVFTSSENTSAPTTASNFDLTIEAGFATNSIAGCAYFISARGRFGIKVQPIREVSQSATA